MANHVIRGYWDCEQCGTKGIDGLADTCPNCGSGKGKHVRYYMKDTEEVSEEELTSAGISKDENDGKHKQWICAYCGFLNKYSATVCGRCAAPGRRKQLRYIFKGPAYIFEKAAGSQPEWLFFRNYFNHF